MAKLDLLHWGTNQPRVGPWRGDATVAQVVPAPGQHLSVDDIDGLLVRLGRDGYRAVLTPALTDIEQPPFLDAGFHVAERLHLLRRSLLDPFDDPAKSIRQRRGRRSDRNRVLAIDAAAFSPFWRFDERGLLDARSATPSSRFRVATSAREVVAYAVTGRAGGIAYLQRLAVDPREQGRGFGVALVLDALRWARTHHCSAMLVNTQESNGTAMALYEGLGFVRESSGLAVLRRGLDDTCADARPT